MFPWTRGSTLGRRQKPGCVRSRASRPPWNVFLNAGDGTFGAPAVYPNPAASSQVLQSGDFDGDGHLDLAELLDDPTTGMAIYFNNGDGTFASPASIATINGSRPFGLAVADFNGDGIDDLATMTALSPNATPNPEAFVLEVFTGSSDRSLSAPALTPIAALPWIYELLQGDFNGDGRQDIAMVVELGDSWGMTVPIPVEVFPNLGDGTFASTPVTYGVGGAAFESPTAIAAGDFNGDGVTDIAVGTDVKGGSMPAAVNVLLSKCP